MRACFARCFNAARHWAIGSACLSNASPPSNSRSLMTSIIRSATSDWSGTFPCRSSYLAGILSLWLADDITLSARDDSGDFALQLFKYVQPLDDGDATANEMSDIINDWSFKSGHENHGKRPFAVHGNSGPGALDFTLGDFPIEQHHFRPMLRCQISRSRQICCHHEPVLIAEAELQVLDPLWIVICHQNRWLADDSWFTHINLLSKGRS